MLDVRHLFNRIYHGHERVIYDNLSMNIEYQDIIYLIALKLTLYDDFCLSLGDK